MRTARGRISKNYYQKIHTWIFKNYGMAVMCLFCGSKKAKRFEWALRYGCEYTEEVKNFIQLCPSCHRKYDYTEEMRAAHSKRIRHELATGIKVNPNSNKGVVGELHTSAKKIVKIDKETNEVITVYGCVNDVAKDGYTPRSISSCLTGVNKTYKGFIWKYFKFLHL